MVEIGTTPERAPLRAVEVPANEVEGLLKTFLDLRAANTSGYRELSESGFTQDVGGQIASMDVYLGHQIVHGARIRLFDPDYAALTPEEVAKLTREEKLAKYEEQTSKYAEIFSDPANLSRKVEVPYVKGELTGFSLLTKLNMHEVAHLYYLRAAYAEQDLPFPKALEYMGI